MGVFVAQFINTSNIAPLAGLSLPDGGDDDWMVEALCREVDPEVFFPEKGGSVKPAKATCAACGVRETCLAWAMEHDEPIGVWGGLSAQERRKLRSKSRPSARPRHPGRDKAVAMYRSGIPGNEVAAAIGVAAETIYRWAEADAAADANADQVVAA